MLAKSLHGSGVIACGTCWRVWEGLLNAAEVNCIHEAFKIVRLAAAPQHVEQRCFLL